MSSRLSPGTSVRPQTRQDLDNRRMNEAFGDFEFRYSIDPYLRDNALARLGYDLGGDALYMGRSSGSSVSPTAAYAGELTEAENLMDRSILREYNEKYPEREGMVDPNTVFYDDQYGSSPMALGHEYAHLGYDELLRLGLFSDGAVSGGYDPEEAIIEVGDLPYADYMSNLPSRLRGAGSDQRRHGDTIQSYNDELTDAGRARAQELFERIQVEAQAERERRGSPPLAVRRIPEEPDKRGVMSILRGLFGGG